jgi:hypothetical protein
VGDREAVGRLDRAVHPRDDAGAEALLVPKTTSGAPARLADRARLEVLTRRRR